MMSGIVDHTPTESSYELQPLFSESAIRHRVEELGAEIAADHPDRSRPLLLLGILKGAVVFMADLARAIPRDVEIDFVAFASYGADTQHSGNVRVLKDLHSDVAGKDVLIVEDILDTGITLARTCLIPKLIDLGACSVKVCSLLDKTCRRSVEIPVHYRGFAVGDHFVVGYGMDHAERYRNLPYIAALSSAPPEAIP
jgi:hypoxanthine phosphoribosyltransferase